MRFWSFSQKQFHIQGSSFVSPVHGCGEARATIEFNNSPAEKKSGEARKQAGKKKKGCGENEFLPACQSAEGGMGWESVSAIPLARGRQNRKIFFSLIEKNFGGARLKNVEKIFLFCPPSGGRKRWAGFNPQNPLDFVQNGFGFRPINTTTIKSAP